MLPFFVMFGVEVNPQCRISLQKRLRRWPPQVQLDCTHTFAAHMGQGAPKDMLVTFVIGADDGMCHKNPVVTTIVGNHRFKKVVHCTEIGGGGALGRISGYYSPFKTTPEKPT